MSDLYPIEYEGKEYTEENVDPIFDSFYTCKEALNKNNGVYMTEDIWIYPDGSTGEW